MIYYNYDIEKEKMAKKNEFKRIKKAKEHAA